MPPTTMTEDGIFAYTGNVPTNGCWVDLDEYTSWDDIKLALRSMGRSAYDEILVADADGLAKKFLSRHDCFDLDGYLACANAEGDPDAKAAFIEHFGEWDAEAFEDAFVGTADHPVDFTQSWFDEMHGDAIRQAEEAGLHIDWDTTAYALFINDFYFDDGYVFRRI